MSQRYADIAAERLRAVPELAAWATGGILNRDPRRSGPNATGEVFETDGNGGDIKPTIAVTYGTTTGVPFAPDAIYDATIVVRVFAPDYTAMYAQVDAAMQRIHAALIGYRHSNVNPGLFGWTSRLGMQAGGQFEDTVYDETRFSVVSTHEGVTI